MEKVEVTKEQYKKIQSILESSSFRTGMTHWLVPMQMKSLENILEIKEDESLELLTK